MYRVSRDCELTPNTRLRFCHLRDIFRANKQHKVQRSLRTTPGMLSSFNEGMYLLSLYEVGDTMMIVDEILQSNTRFIYESVLCFNNIL